MVTSSWIQGKSCSGEKNKVMHKDVKQSQDILIKLISINYRPISFIIESVHSTIFTTGLLVL